MTPTWLRLRPWERHSLVLAVAGGVYVTYGVALLSIPASPTRLANQRLLLNYIPLEWWGTIWIVTGGLAVISTRWPPQSKTWGYTALSGLAAAWASGYLFGVVFLDVPTAALQGAIVWYLVAFMWWAISGLTNPGDVLKAE